MSDVKQDILDELNSLRMMERTGTSDFGEGLDDGAILGLVQAIKVVTSKLEGMVIVNANDMRATINNLESSILHEADIDIGVYLAGLKLMAIGDQS